MQDETYATVTSRRCNARVTTIPDDWFHCGLRFDVDGVVGVYTQPYAQPWRIVLDSGFWFAMRVPADVVNLGVNNFCVCIWHPLTKIDNYRLYLHGTTWHSIWNNYPT